MLTQINQPSSLSQERQTVHKETERLQTMQSAMGVKVAMRSGGQLESTGMLEEAPWGDVPVI